ncbi:hypothetical protein ACFFWC_26705 [Plantactinospora siamensis]|uniref:Uncharacterized protein n=1 Tax=Plantactinospora siamensis TaxID=555372 RepID=A0ABV6NZB5_9ACTN
MAREDLDAVLAALREFVAEVHGFAPDAAPVGTLDLVAGDRRVALELTAPVARALVAALAGYHDPRDRGRCEHCQGRRLDDNFLCLDCHRPNGVFGAMLAERAARYPGDPASLLGPAEGAP